MSRVATVELLKPPARDRLTSVALEFTSIFHHLSTLTKHLSLTVFRSIDMRCRLLQRCKTFYANLPDGQAKSIHSPLRKHNATIKLQGYPLSDPESPAPKTSPRVFSLGKRLNAHGDCSLLASTTLSAGPRPLTRVPPDHHYSHRRRITEGPWKQGRTEAGVRRLRMQRAWLGVCDECDHDARCERLTGASQNLCLMS